MEQNGLFESQADFMKIIKERTAEKDHAEAVKDRIEAAEDRRAAAKDRIEAADDRRAVERDQIEAAEDRKAAAKDRIEAAEDRKAAAKNRKITLLISIFAIFFSIASFIVTLIK